MNMSMPFPPRFAESGSGAVETIEELRLDKSGAKWIAVQGHTNPGDGGGDWFELVAYDGTPGDMAAVSPGDDDNGQTIVQANGYVYARRTNVVTPQQFGAFAAETETEAATMADQSGPMQRWADYCARPETFPIWKWREGNMAQACEAPAGFYRCEKTILFHWPEVALGYQSKGATGPVNMIGKIWTPVNLNINAIRVNGGRRAGKPIITLRACKQAQGDGKVAWDAVAWPDVWKDPAAYPAWAASSPVYKWDTIKVVLASGATMLYDVIASGTTAASAPTDVSGSSFAHGTATLKAIGTCTTTTGRTCADMARDCQDIGIHVDHAQEWDNCYFESDRYTIHVALVPRTMDDCAIGWSRFRGNGYGCKIGFYAAHYLYDRLAANQGARLGLTGLWVGARVRQSDDGVNDYLFNGPVGGESNLANWTASARIPSDRWCNENYIDGGLWYARGTGSYVASNKSSYGYVSDRINTFGGPTHNVVEKVSVEWPGQTGFGEAVQCLFNYGAEHECQVRNDHENIEASAVFCRHQITTGTEEPYRNHVRSARAGRWTLTADNSWSLDESNGRQNRVQQIPYTHDRVKEFIVENLFEDATFSGTDRVYWNRVSMIGSADWTKPRIYGDIRTAVGGSGVKFNPATLTFDFHYNHAPCVYVHLPENHRGRAMIECEIFQDDWATETARWTVTIFDPITGAVLDTSTRPRLCVSANQSLAHAGLSPGSTYKVIWPQSVSHIPIQLSPEPWIRMMMIRPFGNGIRGFRVSVHDTTNASVYSPGQGFNKTSGRVVKAKPQRGILRAPTRLVYADQTGTPKGCFLNRADSMTDYWCTSGNISGIPSPSYLQWGHDGAGTVREYDGAAWQTIATGVSVLEPADFVDY